MTKMPKDSPSTFSRSSSAACVFCQIIDQKIPADRVAEDSQLIAIRDMNKQAPTHILIMPKNHIPNLGSVDDLGLLAALFKKATELAAELDLKKGFRIVVNTGEDGGQTVGHLHIHLLGGRALGWPPG
jgi:histidine triad (HIT) family protein